MKKYYKPEANAFPLFVSDIVASSFELVDVYEGDSISWGKLTGQDKISGGVSD